MVGVIAEGSVDGFEDVVGKVAGGPFVGRGKSREEGAREDILGGGTNRVEVVTEEGFSEGGSDGGSGAARGSGAK